MKQLPRLTGQGFKKRVFKFIDGVRVKEFESLELAAKDAEINYNALSSYMNGRNKKPRKIPANIEYSFLSKLPKEVAEQFYLS